MALVLADRVQQTTTTSGTGTITLSGSVFGYQSFSAIGNGNTTYYTIVDGANWEVGLGTYTSSGTTLSRDTVYASSAGGTTKITLSGATANVFVTYPAERSVNLSSSALTSGRVPYATTDGLLTDAAGFTFNGTALTFPSPFTLGSTSVTTTGTQLNYLNATTGTTGTTSSNLVFSASPTLTGTLTLTGSGASNAQVITSTGATTGSIRYNIANTGGQLWVGVESSAGGQLVSGGSAYASVITTVGATALQLGVNGSVGWTMASTGAITHTGATTLSNALTYGGVTLSNAVTGTGNMVLSASPTLTGTLTAAAANFSGAVTATQAGANLLTIANSASTADARVRVQNTGGSADFGVDGTGPYIQGNTFTGFRFIGVGVTFPSAITYGGVTLSNSVTGTGSMVLSASPTLTGTLTAAAATFSGNTTHNGSANSFDGDTSQFRIRRTSGSANILVMGSVAAWLGSGTNYTDAAIGSIANAYFYVNNSSTIAWSAATSGAFSTPVQLNVGAGATGAFMMNLTSAAATNALFATYVGGTRYAIVGSSGGSGGIIVGDALGEFAIRAESKAINFSTDAGGSIAARISTSGNLYVGATDQSSMNGSGTNIRLGAINTNSGSYGGFFSATGSGSIACGLRVDNTNAYPLEFRYGTGTQLSYWSNNGSTTTFNNPSDARYKTKRPLDAEKMRAFVVGAELGPYNWTDGDKAYGFSLFAQDAYEKAPDEDFRNWLVKKPEDEMEKKWFVNEGGVTYVALWAAQKALAELDELRARVAALES